MAKVLMNNKIRGLIDKLFGLYSCAGVQPSGLVEEFFDASYKGGLALKKTISQLMLLSHFLMMRPIAVI